MDSIRHTCLKLELPNNPELEETQQIFVKGTWFESRFQLFITNGLNAWICEASEDEVRERASQWDQPVSEYIEMAERYLGFQQPGSIYGFADAGKEHRRLSWTFEKQGTKLEWRWKCQPSPNSKKTTAGILDFLMDANIRLSDEVVRKTQSFERLKVEAEKCVAQSEKLSNEKEEFESAIYAKMETVTALIPEVGLDTGTGEGIFAEAGDFNHHVDDMSTKVDQLEQRLNEVEQFYSTTSKKQLNTSRGSSILKDKDKEKYIASLKKRQYDASKREAAAVKRMQELIGGILRQITQHKWAGPFMKPVDVVGLGLHDYYQVIDKPMDFSTIKNKMEAKDGAGYKNVREICADVRLIFKNAMKYNDERDDVHVMAKTLLAKFEEKWLQLLPRVDEEEKRRKEEEAEAQLDMQLFQEAAHAKMARDLSNELDEVDLALEELRETVLQRCRRMSIEEKKRLGTALTQLSPEDLNKALLIVAQDNPSFQATAEEVDLDMDAQSESTLWKLKFFVKDALQVQGKGSAITGGNNNHHHANVNNKRKREICDALAKSSQKKGKKLSS